VAEFDVIVLGGGPGGYLAAERLAHAGRRVLVVEQTAMGGTCLNVGCIPTKALLASVKLFDHARNSEQFGVTVTGAAYDWGQMQAWKAKTVNTLVGGVTTMLARLGVTTATGHGVLTSPTTVDVDGTTHTAHDIIIATGSVPVWPPIPGATDNPGVLDSSGLLGIERLPGRLAIIGGGVIGVEFASIFSRLGTAVTVVEMMDEILPFMDPAMAARLRGANPDVDVRLGAKVESIDGTTVVYSKDGATTRVDADVVLMAVGRRALVEGWGAEAVGLETTRRGVTVDDRMHTNLPGVWAVGDVTGRSALAHAAYRMAEVAVANILTPGAPGQLMRWDTVPWAVYTAPEAAGVGLTQAECARRGIEVTATTVPLVLSGRYVAEAGLDRSGAVTLIAEPASRVVRGIQVLGPYAPEMIWGAAGVLEMELTVDDVRQLVFPHPSVAEGIREAAWAFPDK